jgi:hypothetical protein
MHVMSKMAVVAAAATAVMSAGLTPALADPPPGTLPALTDVVGVGADTTANVMNAIANSWDAGTPAHKLYSWDPPTDGFGEDIVTKGDNSVDTTCLTGRPLGGNSGILALKATVTDLGHPCIDFARSSLLPQAGDPAGLVWVGWGTDAVSWTVPRTANGLPASLTVAQLRNIYLCTPGYRHWNSSLVGGTSGALIVPVLPEQSEGSPVDSDVGAYFLTRIGVTTAGSCVVNGSVTIPGDPNDPAPILDVTGVSQRDSSGNYLTGNQYQFNNFPNSIFPYSVADWIAQQPGPEGGGHSTATFSSGNLRPPQPVQGISPIVTHAGSIDTINPSFTSTLAETVWNVMPNGGTEQNPAIPAGPLTTMFGPGGVVCSRTFIEQSYGFLPLSNCGAELFHT